MIIILLCVGFPLMLVLACCLRISSAESRREEREVKR